MQQVKLILTDLLESHRLRQAVLTLIRQMKMLLDHPRDLRRLEVGVVDLDIVRKRDLPIAALQAILCLLAHHAVLGDREVALGWLVEKTIFRLVALDSNRSVRDKLDVVHGPAGRLEAVGHALEVVPVALQVKCPHEGEDHPLKIRLQKRLEDIVAKLRDELADVSPEDLDHGLDHHMIVKQPEIGDLPKFLADGHFPDSTAADQYDQIHSIIPVIL